jgi:uncharacterized protein YdeI (YjbR/CyaY-like superfamily)
MNPKIDDLIANVKQWSTEFKLLRSILLECGLTEELKWKNPCYTFQNANIVMIGGFKEYCTLSFFKGVLLNDSAQILDSPGENSQTVRMVKFTNVKEIESIHDTLKAYIFEAIEIEKAGIKVEMKKSKNLDLTEELIGEMEKSSEFKKAFNALTPGRQRGYHLYFSAAKQSKTRLDRIEKYRQRILDGIGFHDCVCGHSKRMPTCDGSHKFL